MPDDDHAYLPTPAEIAAACAAIQSTWSDAERRRRAGLSRRSEPYVVPSLSIASEAVADDLDS